MKCALELMATASVKAEENAKKEAERIAREKAARRAYTIKYCEKLGELLEEKANRGERLTTSFCCSEDAIPLTHSYSQYSDHRKSYYFDGESLDLDFVAEWFDTYCFKVTIEHIRYWRYGFGVQRGYEVNIIPNPECID